MSSLQRIWRAHQGLPRLVRVQWMVPLTVALVMVGGLVFTLPPGPLCDEGMILFMEGGCDFGLSNIYFYSKLGLLVSLNVAFVIAWFEGIAGFLGFVPHFTVAAFLAWVQRSGGRCDSYYDHPNGSIGQMVLELTAVALLGLIVLMRWQKGKTWHLALALLGWNLVHVGFFYLWLLLFPHWTWAHSTSLVLSLVATAGILSTGKWLPRRGSAAEPLDQP